MTRRLTRSGRHYLMRYRTLSSARSSTPATTRCAGSMAWRQRVKWAEMEIDETHFHKLGVKPPDQIWACDDYQVLVRKNAGHPEWPSMTALSVRRMDRKPIRDWRIMQVIKN